MRRKPPESIKYVNWSSTLSSRATPIISNESLTRCSNGTGPIDSPSNRQGDAIAIRGQSDTTESEEKKQLLASAKRVFKKLARSYLNRRAPPDTESLRELWEYKDVLDLKTVLAWRDEVGIRRGVLYEDGRIEFEEWPVPPHEDIIDIFENVFKGQFVHPWTDPNNWMAPFRGLHSKGKFSRFSWDLTDGARYKLPWEEKAT